MPIRLHLPTWAHRLLDRLTGQTGPQSSLPASDSNNEQAIAKSIDLEARLHGQEECTRSILASMHEVVWSFTPDFEKLIYVNQATEAVLGYPPEVFLARQDLWLASIHPGDRPMLVEAARAYDGLGWTELTYRIVHPNAEIRWVRSRSRVIRNPDGSPLRIDGVSIDVTERKQVEDALQNRAAILDAVGTAAGRLLSAASWQEILPEMLAGLGQAIQASRAYVFETVKLEPGKNYIRQLSEWTASGIPALLDPDSPCVLPIHTSGFANWEESLAAGQILQRRASSFLDSERSFLEPLQVYSLMVVPIHLEGQWWGFMGFNDCQTERHWLPSEEDALKTAANLLGAAILRQQADGQLQHLLEAEREERRAAIALRETAVVFNQSLNYDRILDLVIEQLPRVVPYDGACILLVIGGLAYVARQRGYDHPGAPPDRVLSGRSFEISKIPNLRRVIETHLAEIVFDSQSDPNWVREIIEREYRSWIGAPLLLGDQVEAILSLDKMEPQFYTRAHAERLVLFTGQASLALRNAQLFSETKDTLEREQRMGEITRAISSELDLSTILQSVVRLVVELAEAEAGSMAILDQTNQTLSYSYLYNLPLEFSKVIDPPGTSLAWEVVLTRRSILLNDYGAHPKANPLWVEAGIKAFFGVPIIVGNTCLGVVCIFTYDPEKKFEPRDLEQVEMVGRQAGVAIQNARLFEAAQRRATEAVTLRQAASAVNSALALDEVLEQILLQLETVVPYDSASIYLYEEDYLHIKAGRGFVDLPSLMTQRFSIQNSLIRAIEEANAPLIIEDAQADPRFEEWGETDNIHGWIGVPLRVRSNRIGYLSIDSRKVSAYRQSDADLAQAFANEVAIAIENARLFEQVQLLAITDPLTGIYNRRYFFEGARREFECARRYGLPLSVILLDLDHFKLVNDTYGHLAGDRVLVAVASRCKSILREVDVLARYGGDELIFLLPQTHLAGAHLLAERLHSQVMDLPINAGRQRISISASMGIAELDATCINVQDLIHCADQALYATKNSGRGSISVWLAQSE